MGAVIVLFLGTLSRGMEVEASGSQFLGTLSRGMEDGVRSWDWKRAEAQLTRPRPQLVAAWRSWCCAGPRHPTRSCDAHFRAGHCDDYRDDGEEDELPYLS